MAARLLADERLRICVPVGFAADAVSFELVQNIRMGKPAAHRQFAAAGSR